MLACKTQGLISNHKPLCFYKNKADTLVRLQLEEESSHFLVLKDKERVIARWNTATATRDEIQDTANSYIAGVNSNLELRLRHFWKQHPHAKFSLDSIAGAVDSTKTNIRSKITLLIEKGILREQRAGQDTVIYSLNDDNEETQEYIQQMDKMCVNKIGGLGYQLVREAALA